MIVVHDILKADPYRCFEDDQFYIPKKVFFNHVYVKPSQSIINKLKKRVPNGNSRVKFFHINGYAGCGKTLFAHYIIQKYGYDDDFFYEFDQGEGKDYSLDFVRKRIIQQLSEHIANVIMDNTAILSTYSNIGKNVYGESPDYEMLSEFFFNTPWLDNDKVDGYDFSQYGTTVSIIVDTLNNVANIEKYNINDIIKFLIFCDYYWRCAETVSDINQTYDKISFCLFDNLDNLQRDAVVDFYIDIHDVIRKLSQQRIIKRNKDIRIKFIYLFPTREVTNQRLIDGLRRKNKEDLLPYHGVVCSFEMDNNCASVDKIIESRSKYWVSKNIKKKDLEKLDIISSLMQIPYVQGSFSSLLNKNYIYCVDRILDLYEEMPNYVQECYSMHSDCTFGDDYLICSKEGTRGILLRMLLEWFKKRNIYDSVTNTDEANGFNVNGKLGLCQLKHHSKDGEYQVSVSRLILTFIRESKNKTVRINHLFSCFSNNTDGYEICRYLYALSENIRDTWRRLLVFTCNSPNSIEDLYKQYDAFTTGKNMSSAEFSEVEICLSGDTYINTVVTNFEFFLSRVRIRGDIDNPPPLFSKKSLSKHNDKEIYLTSIESVLESIEICADEIYKFNCDIVKNCLENEYEMYIERMFVSSNNDLFAKQSHLSRIIFAHISYIERFRRFIIQKIPKGAVDELTDDAVSINKRIISYLIRYLALFDNTPFCNDYNQLLTNEFLPDEYNIKVNQKRNCRDIIRIINNQTNTSIEQAALEMIDLGYQKQRKAQIKLLEIIKEIHNNDYKIISKIELTRKEQL